MTMEPSPFVLPTYQSVLNRTIANVIEELNFGTPMGFYRCLRTLLRISPPIAKKEIEADLEQFLEKLDRTRQTSSFDLYQTRRKRNNKNEKTIMELGPPLFESLMEALHDKGFLLKTPTTPKHKTDKKFGMP